MRAFNFTDLAADEAVKIVGKAVTVEFEATGAADLVVCVKAGRSDTKMTELKTVYGVLFTRMTLNGTDTQAITIDGLTPGLVVAGSVVSGAGALKVNITTGAER